MVQALSNSDVTCEKCYSTAPAHKVLRGSPITTVAALVLGMALAAGATYARGAYWERRYQAAASNIARMADLVDSQVGEAARQALTGAGVPAAPDVRVWEVLIALAIALGPALAYHRWRGRYRTKICAACGSREVLPADSPRAAQIRAQTPSP